MSGMTWFGRGFHLAPEAFASEGELTKTILHELFRLNVRAVGVEATGAAATTETSAAAGFADRTYRIGRFLGLWQ